MIDTIWRMTDEMTFQNLFQSLVLEFYQILEAVHQNSIFSHLGLYPKSSRIQMNSSS